MRPRRSAGTPTYGSWIEKNPCVLPEGMNRRVANPFQVVPLESTYVLLGVFWFLAIEQVMYAVDVPLFQGPLSQVHVRHVEVPTRLEFLRRRFPERWGDREKHKHGHDHRHEHTVMSDEDRAIASRVASARLRRASPN